MRDYKFYLATSVAVVLGFILFGLGMALAVATYEWAFCALKGVDHFMCDR